MKNYLQQKIDGIQAMLNVKKGYTRISSGANQVKLENCVDDDSLINLKLYGNSVQDGTPAPDNPIEIQSVGELSRNLFDKSLSINDGIKNETEVDTYGGMILSHANTISMLKPNTTYNITFDYECTAIPDDATLTYNILGFYFYSGVDSNLYPTIKANILKRLSVGEKGTTNVTFTTSETFHDEVANYHMSVYTNRYETSDGTYIPNTVIFKNICIKEAHEDDSLNFEPYGKYKIPIKAKGKNLFNVNNYLSDRNQPVIVFDCSNLNVGTKYTLSSDKPLSWFKISTYASGYNSVQKAGEIYSFTFTMARHSNISESETQYIIIGISGVSAISDISELDGYNIQIEEGSDATDYEAYHEPKTFNIWANEPIRKFESALEALNVSDCLDVKNRCIVRNVYEEVINGTAASDWGDTYAPTIIYSKTLPAALSYSVTGARTYILSNYSVGKSQYVWFANATHNKVALGTNLYGGTTEDELIAFIEKCNNTQPFKVFYPLLEPIEETIEVPEIPTVKGTTIYEINTTIPSSAVEAEYYSLSKAGE